MKELSKEEFKSLVEKEDLPILATFSAPWCGHCSALYPILKEASQKYIGKAVFVGINLDNCPELADELNIEVIPTLILFTKKVPSKFLIAPKDEGTLSNWLKNHGVN